MTTAVQYEVDRRILGRSRKHDRERLRFADDLVLKIREVQLYSSRTRFPSDRYREKPVEFCREVLGFEPWERQVEILEAVRDHKRVAVTSGHKCGKSTTAAAIALWFYCSFDDARVVMTSTTSRQVDQILWRELRMLRARSGRCIECKREDPEGLRIIKPCPHSTLIEGEQGELARTGLKSTDFREVVGFTAREAEAVAGVSGRNLLYLADEASGIPDSIFVAIEGNRAGGARIVLLSNPTRNQGEFFDAFHSKQHLYRTIHMSSEETPNAISGKPLIPGLATQEWIEEKREEWGEDSRLFKVRVQGVHALNEEGRIFTVYAIGEAESRWYTADDAGRLFVGVDPAGESGTGDDTAVSVRRGIKQLALRTERGLDADAHVTMLVRLLEEFRLPREAPVIVVDRGGSIGTKLYRALGDYLDQHPDAFELVGLMASDRAVRQPQLYDRIRDELAANLEQWFRDGGAIVEDAKLARELNSLEWFEHVNGRLKLTPKDKLKKELGRSPDRYDALALSCWEPLSLREGTAPLSSAALAARDTPAFERDTVMDPYAAMDTWRGG